MTAGFQVYFSYKIPVYLQVWACQKGYSPGYSVDNFGIKWQMPKEHKTWKKLSQYNISTADRHNNPLVHFALISV